MWFHQHGDEDMSILAEVEQIKGGRLTIAELTAVQEMLDLGYRNAYDICDMLREW
jgi:hypothetical protein